MILHRAGPDQTFYYYLILLWINKIIYNNHIGEEKLCVCKKSKIGTDWGSERLVCNVYSKHFK